jgi:hypothetical protein
MTKFENSIGIYMFIVINKLVIFMHIDLTIRDVLKMFFRE